MRLIIGALICFIFAQQAPAAELKIGDKAPAIELKTDENKDFKLEDRKGQWTVLYFYPKAETPGCTKQACAFRDSIKLIRDEGAEVFGVSADDVDALKAFKKKHNLNFSLLADTKLKTIDAYGTKMPMLSMSKRWTFIVSPDLKIAYVDKSVDPVTDAEKVQKKIKELKLKN